jgi:hypothetical protein
MIKFTPHKTSDLLAPGFLNTLAQRLFAGEKLTAKEKLSESQLAQVVGMYARFDPDFDIREVEADKLYQTHDGKDFLGSDLKAITALMYSKPRSAYLTNKRPFIHDSSLSSGVPIPMLAFKRHRDLSYNSFRMSPEDFYVEENCILECLNVEKLWKLDQLLGNSLASTSIVDGVVSVNEYWGLGMLCALDWEWTYKTMRICRDLGFGTKRKGSFASTFGASAISFSDINEELSDEDMFFINIYNNSNGAVRHLLTQRWVWYGMHRNDDMICDPRDWDSMPTSVDKTSNAFTGIKPQSGPISPLEFYK